MAFKFFTLAFLAVIQVSKLTGQVNGYDYLPFSPYGFYPQSSSTTVTSPGQSLATTSGYNGNSISLSNNSPFGGNSIATTNGGNSIATTSGNYGPFNSVYGGNSIATSNLGSSIATTNGINGNSIAVSSNPAQYVPEYFTPPCYGTCGLPLCGNCNNYRTLPYYGYNPSCYYQNNNYGFNPCSCSNCNFSPYNYGYPNFTPYNYGFNGQTINQNLNNNVVQVA